MVICGLHTHTFKVYVLGQLFGQLLDCFALTNNGVYLKQA